MGIKNEIRVLDKGFVRLRNLAGPTRRVFKEFDAEDIDPAQAARMSFDQMDTKRTYEQDMRLNEYLLKNGHTSPLEQIQVWLEVKLPIFVDREWVRHRTFSRNEVSGRYVTLPEDWYIPEIVGGKAADRKQGQEDDLPIETQDWLKTSLEDDCRYSYRLYKDAIDKGVAPEHARMLLHLNHYVTWVQSANLHNLFHFLKLRAHPHAQIEIQKYAEAIVELLREHLPGLMGLFDTHIRKVSADG